jgi:membrane-bound ClpP family serine protease
VTLEITLREAITDAVRDTIADEMRELVAKETRRAMRLKEDELTVVIRRAVASALDEALRAQG